MVSEEGEEFLELSPLLVLFHRLLNPTTATNSPTAAAVSSESHSHSFRLLLSLRCRRLSRNHSHSFHHLLSPLTSTLTGSPLFLSLLLLSPALPTPPIAFLNSPTETRRFRHKKDRVLISCLLFFQNFCLHVCLRKYPVRKIPLLKAASQPPILRRGSRFEAYKWLQWHSARSFRFRDNDQNCARETTMIATPKPSNTTRRR